MKIFFTPILLLLSAFCLGQSIEQDTALAHQLFDRGMEIYRIGRNQDVQRMNDAIDTLNWSASLFEKHASWKDWAISKAKMGKAMTYLAQFEEGIQLFENAIAFLDEKIGEKNLPSAYLWEDFSFLQDQNNNVLAAIECLKNEIEIKQQHLGEFYEGIGYDYSGLGVQFRKGREYDKALEYLEKGKTSTAREFGENHTDVAAIDMQIGIIYDIIGEPKTAIEYYLKSLDFYYSVKKEVQVEHANLFWTLGIAYAKIEKYDESIDYLTKAEEYYEATYGTQNPTLYYLYRELGNPYFKSGQVEQGIAYMEKTLEGFQKIFPENHPTLLTQAVLLASYYRVAGDYSKSLALTQDVLNQCSSGFSESNYLKNPAIEQISDIAIGARAFYEKIIITYKMESDDLDQQHLVVETSLLYDNLVQKELQSLGDQFTSATNLFELGEGVYRNIYSIGVEKAYDLYEASKEEKYLNTAFQFAEKSKSLLLTQQMNEVEAKFETNLDEESLAKEKEYLDKIAYYESRIHQLYKAKDNVELVKVRDDSLFNLKRSYERFTKKLEEENPKYYERKYGFDFPMLSEIQEILEPNELLIEYIYNKEENGLIILTIDEENGLRFAKVPIDKMSKKAIALNRLLRSHNLLRADRRQKFVNLSHDLYNQFLKPIENQLVGKEKIIIIGEGITNYIPFEVLLKTNENQAYHELDYLVKDFEISYHYSGSLFKRSREKEMDFSGDLLAFAPVFSEEGFSPALGDNVRWFADTTFRSLDGENFSPLIYSEKEVSDIQNIFERGSISKVLLHESADESTLKSELEKNYRYVHIASHSFANIDHPKFSGIACTQSESESGEDNILYVGEIYNLGIKSDLVVLSSCESGIGKLVSGEGLLGLNRSFVYAGVPNVIFSLWKVYDQATSQLMTEFYSETLSGQEYSTALRNAKLKLLKDPVTASPDIWGAFLLIGR
jgi:CHAT domain-containing protein